MEETCRQRHGRPTLKKLSLNWNAPDRYIELLNFEMEIMNKLQTKTYELTEEEKVPIIKRWLGTGFVVNTDFYKFQDRSMQKIKGLFLMLGVKFKPHHNEAILSLQYFKKKSRVYPGVNGQVVYQVHRM